MGSGFLFFCFVAVLCCCALLLALKSKTQKTGGGYWGDVPPAVLGFGFWCLRLWGGLLLFCAGIRVSAYAAQALPLCGAALTFFAAAKKVSKESGLTPPALVSA
ncbi:hypothetical protein [Burkholderia sp. Ac-20365]|uniref:hypothetical protein n=1 Tax=Burkholderia sp. Ac-20365 TaxID=2703897 RepID=UPI00197C95D7|nr:hypothetical protein [Burkholderia sp. Ac-20365]MBN3760001.1 hypothetical protein [Burkholderia sp. Ac-20365]